MSYIEDGFSYMPAELRKGSKGRWMIRYRVRMTQPPHRWKVYRRRVPPHSNVRERLRLARKMESDINAKLANGWRPWHAEVSPKASVMFQDAAQSFVERSDKLREDTLRSYRSFISMMIEFQRKHHGRILRVMEWDKEVAQRYVHWVLVDRANSNRTRNNHRDFGVQLWRWFKRYGYADVNVFEHIEKLKNAKKRRLVIPREHLVRIVEHFRQEEPYMEVVFYLMYACLIRRTEMCKLRVGDIHLAQQYIYIGPEVAKMGEEGTPVIDRHTACVLAGHVAKASLPRYYLLGKDGKPGPVPMQPKQLSDAWARMRDALQLDKRYQLYSLKDTGIDRLLFEGHDVQMVRMQARHSSLEMTSKYLVRPNPIAQGKLMQSSAHL